MNKTAEKSLTKLKKDAIDVLMRPVVIADLEGNVVYANRAFAAAWGYGEAAELIGLPVSELWNLTSNSWLMTERLFRMDSVLFELEACRKDGSGFRSRISANHLKNPSGTITGFVLDCEKAADEPAQGANEDARRLHIRETHHRIKNNMQLICSLLDIQARHSRSRLTRSIVRDIKNQINSINLVHEKIYRDESLTSLDFAEYVETLAAHLYRSYRLESDQITLRIDTDRFAHTKIHADRAVHFGLLINELLSNALKHAFPDGREGTVNVSLETNDRGQHLLTVSDNGIGLPKTGNQFGSTGFRIIYALVEQIQGKARTINENGFSFILSFQL